MIWVLGIAFEKDIKVGNALNDTITTLGKCFSSWSLSKDGGFRMSLMGDDYLPGVRDILMSYSTENDTIKVVLGIRWSFCIVRKEIYFLRNRYDWFNAYTGTELKTCGEMVWDYFRKNYPDVFGSEIYDIHRVRMTIFKDVYDYIRENKDSLRLDEYQNLAVIVALYEAFYLYIEEKYKTLPGGER